MDEGEGGFGASGIGSFHPTATAQLGRGGSLQEDHKCVVFKELMEFIPVAF